MNDNPERQEVVKEEPVVAEGTQSSRGGDGTANEDDHDPESPECAQDTKEEVEAEEAEIQQSTEGFFQALKAAHLTLDILAVIVFGASFAGFATGDDSVRWTLTLASSLGVSLWGLFLLLSCFVFWKKRTDMGGFLAWTRYLAMFGFCMSLLTGVLLPIGALASCGPGQDWLAAFYHVAGFTGALLCLLTWSLLPRVVAAHAGESLPESKHTRPARCWIVPALFLVGSLVAYWLLLWEYGGNPHLDVSEYPDHKTSPYKLPFPKGLRSFLFQGNGGKFSLAGEYGFDFVRPCGTPVLASRAGTVDVVVDSNNGSCWTHWPDCPDGNIIAILHDDGTAALYIHISQGTAMVKVGDRVQQGTPIALVGDVGYSAGPHIHFEVVNYDGGESLPVSFQDVSSDYGIPRALHYYTSGNEQVSSL